MAITKVRKNRMCERCFGFPGFALHYPVVLTWINRRTICAKYQRYTHSYILVLNNVCKDVFITSCMLIKLLCLAKFTSKELSFLEICKAVRSRLWFTYRKGFPAIGKTAWVFLYFFFCSCFLFLYFLKFVSKYYVLSSLWLLEKFTNGDEILKIIIAALRSNCEVTQLNTMKKTEGVVFSWASFNCDFRIFYFCFN